MNENLRTMIDHIWYNFARPRFTTGSDDKIQEADQTIQQLKRKEIEMRARLRLLSIQSTPRGEINDG